MRYGPEGTKRAEPLYDPYHGEYRKNPRLPGIHEEINQKEYYEFSHLLPSSEYRPLDIHTEKIERIENIESVVELGREVIGKVKGADPLTKPLLVTLIQFDDGEKYRMFMIGVSPVMSVRMRDSAIIFRRPLHEEPQAYIWDVFHFIIERFRNAAKDYIE